MYENKINYKIEGRGKSIILVHGLSDNLEYWEPLVQTLKDKYHIIRYDLRGHGKSPLGNDKITINTYVNDLNNLINKLNITQTALIGFSLGGAVALEYTCKYPEKVTSLILMSSFPKCTQNFEKTCNELKEAVKKGFEEFFDIILPKVLCPEVIIENQHELETIKEYATKNANTKGIEKAIDAMLNFDITEDISEINKSTLIICGKYDNLTEVSLQKIMHEKIENSELIILDNLKHNLLVGENIEIVSGMIDTFLQNSNVSTHE